jgi:hypothetical protein
MPPKPRLGELLVKNDLLKQDEIDEALRIQVGGNRRLGNILVRMKALSEDQLAEILAEQLQIDITHVGDNVASEVRKTIPRHLCKKYDIIPLKHGPKNTIAVAMADPSDDLTIRDLEQYTGRVVDPRLARQSDIAAGIKKHIPFTLGDLIAPQSSTMITRIGVAACLVFIVALGWTTYNYVQNTTYGTVSKTEESTIYKNHDLMLAFDAGGKINLLGRGAYAKGYYSIAFNDTAILKAFIESRKTDFSDKQQQWLDWTINQIDGKQKPHAIASAK